MERTSVLILMIAAVAQCGLGSAFAESKPDLRDRSIRKVVFAVARRQMCPLAEGEWKQGTEEESMNSKLSTGPHWDYPWGVTLYGLVRLAEVSGDRTLCDYVMKHNELVLKDYEYAKWREQTFGKRGDGGRYGRLFRMNCLDDCGSMANAWTAALMASETKTPEMTSLPARCADYISSRQGRLSDGTFCRGTELWADDLYMSCPFLARWSTYKSDDRYVTDAARQIVNQAKRLQDKDGLWYHGWFDDQQKTSCCKWGRSNGWSIVTQVEVLSHLPENHPDRAKLLTILRKHIAGLKRVQSPSGMWRQLLDRPDYWEETSCTAMFTYAIARACSRGWIPKENLKVAEKAFRALKTRIAPDGTVIGTCVGTDIGANPDYYLTRSQPVDDWHAQGAILLAGAELMAAGKE